jgi:hypothetical protein
VIYVLQVKKCKKTLSSTYQFCRTPRVDSSSAHIPCVPTLPPTKQHHQWAALSHPARVCVRRADFVRERALVVKLQARVRGWLLRRGMRHWHAAATMVRLAAAGRRDAAMCCCIACTYICVSAIVMFRALRAFIFCVHCSLYFLFGQPFAAADSIAVSRLCGASCRAPRSRRHRCHAGTCPDEGNQKPLEKVSNHFNNHSMFHITKTIQIFESEYRQIISLFFMETCAEYSITNRTYFSRLIFDSHDINFERRRWRSLHRTRITLPRRPASPWSPRRPLLVSSRTQCRYAWSSEAKVMASASESFLSSHEIKHNLVQI